MSKDTTLPDPTEPILFTLPADMLCLELGVRHGSNWIREYLEDSMRPRDGCPRSDAGVEEKVGDVRVPRIWNKDRFDEESDFLSLVLV